MTLTRYREVLADLEQTGTLDEVQRRIAEIRSSEKFNHPSYRRATSLLLDRYVVLADRLQAAMPAK
jgi:hypothetical protein